MNGAEKILSGAARKQVTTPIEVELNGDTIALAAKAASKAVVANHPEMKPDEKHLCEFNAVALRAVLTRAIDEDAQIPRWVKIPAYCDSMLQGVTTRIGRNLVKPSIQGSEWSKPEGYDDVYLTLQSYGIPCLAIRRLNEQFTKTLALNVETIDDVAVVVGNLESVAVEDVVRRSLLRIAESSREVWNKLCGSLGLQYGEVDVLISNYFTSEASVCR